MPIYTLPSSNDLRVAYDFVQLIGISSPNIGFKNVLEDTSPQFANTTNLGLSEYYGYGGFNFFNILIQSNNGSQGYVKVDAPWSQNSSGLGTAFIGNTKQAFEVYNGSIDISASPIYPYQFWYWYENQSMTQYFTNSLSFSPYDSEIQDPFASFTCYFRL